MSYTPSYTRRNYVNNQAPSINAENLNAIEDTLVALETNAQSNGQQIDDIASSLSTEIQNRENAVNGLQTDLDTVSGDLAIEFFERTEAIKKLKETDAETNRSLDALWKINKGQTYDFEKVTTDAYTDDVVSGGRIADVQMLGGESVVVDGQLLSAKVESIVSKSQYASVDLGNLTWVATSANRLMSTDIASKTNKPSADSIIANIKCDKLTTVSANDVALNKVNNSISINVNGNILVYASEYIGNPSAFTKAMDGVKLHYEPIDSTTVDVLAEVEIPSSIKSIDLRSAGSVYDYFDFDAMKLHKRVGVVDLGSLNWSSQTLANSRICYYTTDIIGYKKDRNKTINAILPLPITQTYEGADSWGTNTYLFNPESATLPRDSFGIIYYSDKYASVSAFKSAMNGVLLYYELAEEVVTDITEDIDFFDCESGGTITYVQTDTQLPIPHTVEYTVALKEVE